MLRTNIQNQKKKSKVDVWSSFVEQMSSKISMLRLALMGVKELSGKLPHTPQFNVTFFLVAPLLAMESKMADISRAMEIAMLPSSATSRTE